MNARIRWFKASVEAKLPRLSRRRLSMPNQISTWFSHEQCLGVYTKRMRCSVSCKNSARESMLCKMPDLPFSPNGSFMPQSSATQATSEADLWVLSWSAMKTHFASESVDTVARMWLTKSSSVRVSTDGGADHFAGGHLKVRYQRLSPMSGVLEFVQFQLALGHRLVRVYPLQGLYPGFFINTDNMHARFVQLLCLVIEFTYRSEILPEGGFIFHFVVKPVFDPMRFQIPLILKNARHCWMICYRLCPGLSAFAPVPVVSSD